MATITVSEFLKQIEQDFNKRRRKRGGFTFQSSLRKLGAKIGRVRHPQFTAPVRVR